MRCRFFKTSSVASNLAIGSLFCWASAQASDALTTDMIRIAEKYTNNGFEAYERYLYWAGADPLRNSELYANEICSSLRSAELMLDAACVSMAVGGPNEIGIESPIYVHARSQAEELANRFPCADLNIDDQDTAAF